MSPSPDQPSNGSPRGTLPWPTVATHRDRLRAGAREWFSARPLEVVGLSVLLAGTMAASLLVLATVNSGATAAGDSSVVGPHADEWDATTGTPADQDRHDGETLRVHVSGAVHAPGVVEVPAGARVGDVIVAAGGPRWSADIDAVNLARPVTDGEQIRLPFDGELASAGAGLAHGGASGGGGIININRATAEELTSLPGIGPTRAQAIVEHRERHGPFRVPGDLRAVSGIGEATFQNLAERVTVQ